MADTNRDLWNQQQQALRQALSEPGQHAQAIELFLKQHAMVHAARMSELGLPSFEDEVLLGMTESGIRRVPKNIDHSIAWLIWHIARIEDITMNILVAGSPQLLHQEGWYARMKVNPRDTGNAMSRSEVVDLSSAIDIGNLKEYRLAVGRKTRLTAQQLTAEELAQRVDPQRLEQARLEGAVLQSSADLLNYWGNLTLAGLLLMPPTRHNLVHLNEALRIKQKK
jgi:hypothetical protein